MTRIFFLFSWKRKSKFHMVFLTFNRLNPPNFLTSSSTAKTVPSLTTNIQSTWTTATSSLLLFFETPFFSLMTSLHMGSAYYVCVFPLPVRTLCIPSCLYFCIISSRKTSLVQQFGIHLSLLWGFIERLTSLSCFVLLCMHYLPQWDYNFLKSSNLT